MISILKIKVLMDFLFSRKCWDCEIELDILEMPVQIHSRIATWISNFLEYRIFKKIELHRWIRMDFPRISFIILYNLFSKLQCIVICLSRQGAATNLRLVSVSATRIIECICFVSFCIVSVHTAWLNLNWLKIATKRFRLHLIRKID